MGAEDGRHDADAASPREHIRRRRLDAGMTVEELAAKAGVSARWLAGFEAGERDEEMTYERLLALVRATQPDRPDWWDEGHEHDLHLGPTGVPDSQRAQRRGYWARIEVVREANRASRGRR